MKKQLILLKKKPKIRNIKPILKLKRLKELKP